MGDLPALSYGLGADVCRRRNGFWITGHGGHAQYMTVPVSTIVLLRDDLSFAVGAAISCGTVTAFGALRRLALHGDETIAVFGQGPVGLSTGT